MNKVTCSLIVSTYNWPEALELVLKSIKNQQEQPDELIVADDGSKNETRILIERYKNELSIPLLHIWHEDKGFRLAKIRNKAIKKASGEFIVQIDGDTILHKKFIKDYKKIAVKNIFISGSRVLLSEEKTKNVIAKKQLFFSPFSKQITNRFNAIYFPILNMFSSSKKEPINKLIFKVRGCNMGFWKSDLVEVNGYNENIKGWGREDSEIALRLLKKGVSFKRIKMACIQYHLYHNEADKNNTAFNTSILEKSKNDSYFRTKNGIYK